MENSIEIIQILKVVLLEFPLWLSRLQTWLVSTRMRIWSLASLSGLRVQHFCELWRRLQTWLGSCVAVAVAVAGSCSSHPTPNLGTSICHRCDPKKLKTNKQTKVVYYVIQQSCLCVGFCKRYNHCLKEISALLCSLQHYHNSQDMGTI